MMMEREGQSIPNGIFSSPTGPPSPTTSSHYTYPGDDDGSFTGSIGLEGSTSALLPSTKTAYDGSESTDPPTYNSTSTRSTLHTSPSTSSSSSSQGWAAAKPSGPASSLPVAAHSHHSGLSAGELAAAIVVPVLLLLALLALAFFFLRRRSQETRRRAGSGGSSSILPVLKEKWGSLRSSGSSTTGMPQMNGNASGPVVMGTQNNSYYTGLDTSSHGGSSARDGSSGDYAPGRRSEGGTTFVVPPPPYNMTSAPALPQLVEPSGMEFDANRFTGDFPTPPQSAQLREPSPPVSPLQSPVSPVAHGISAGELLAMPLDPPQPSSRSARSITSTLYSDTASVHSARAARRSVGANVIAPSSASGYLSAGDPFDDPNTPNTPLSAQEAGHRRLE